MGIFQHILLNSIHSLFVVLVWIQMQNINKGEMDPLI